MEPLGTMIWLRIELSSMISSVSRSVFMMDVSRSIVRLLSSLKFID